jgi:3'-5' exonuclease
MVVRRCFCCPSRALILWQNRRHAMHRVISSGSEESSDRGENRYFVAAHVWELPLIWHHRDRRWSPKSPLAFGPPAISQRQTSWNSALQIAFSDQHSQPAKPTPTDRTWDATLPIVFSTGPTNKSDVPASALVQHSLSRPQHSSRSPGAQQKRPITGKATKNKQLEKKQEELEAKQQLQRKLRDEAEAKRKNQLAEKAKAESRRKLEDARIMKEIEEANKRKAEREKEEQEPRQQEASELDRQRRNEEKRLAWISAKENKIIEGLHSGDDLLKVAIDNYLEIKLRQQLGTYPRNIAMRLDEMGRELGDISMYISMIEDRSRWRRNLFRSEFRRISKAVESSDILLSAISKEVDRIKQVYKFSEAHQSREKFRKQGDPTYPDLRELTRFKKITASLKELDRFMHDFLDESREKGSSPGLKAKVLLLQKSVNRMLYDHAKLSSYAHWLRAAHRRVSLLEHGDTLWPDATKLNIRATYLKLDNILLELDILDLDPSVRPPEALAVVYHSQCLADVANAISEILDVHTPLIGHRTIFRKWNLDFRQSRRMITPFPPNEDRRWLQNEIPHLFRRFMRFKRIRGITNQGLPNPSELAQVHIEARPKYVRPSNRTVIGRLRESKSRRKNPRGKSAVVHQRRERMSPSKHSLTSFGIFERLAREPTPIRQSFNRCTLKRRPPSNGRSQERDVSDSIPEISPNSEDSKVKEIPPLLLYNMDQRLQQEMAKKRSPDQLYFSHELFRGPGNTPVRVYYCTKLEHSEKIAKEFVNERILGFDLEWAPYNRSSNIKENISLIQLASPSKIVLFHIARHYGDTPETLLGPTLRKLLESADVIKAGVNILGDFKRLKTFLNVDPHGYIELSHIQNLVKNRRIANGKISKALTSLATLVELNFGLSLNKSADIRSSQWHLLMLNHKQTTYAAADAYAGLQLFHALERQRLRMDPMPPRPPFAELCQDITPPAPRASSSSDDEEAWSTESEISEEESESGNNSDESSGEESLLSEEPLPEDFSQNSEVGFSSTSIDPPSRRKLRRKVTLSRGSNVRSCRSSSVRRDEAESAVTRMGSQYGTFRYAPLVGLADKVSLDCD